VAYSAPLVEMTRDPFPALQGLTWWPWSAAMWKRRQLFATLAKHDPQPVRPAGTLRMT